MPENYIASPELANAVNVALLLGKPLLLTGEPGTGKTRLAFRIAWELGYDNPLVFETKSTNTATDLFYTYNSLARFHAAQLKKESKSAQIGKVDGVEFITYNALGKAIIMTQEESTYTKLLPSGFEHKGRKRSIVLIDEVDKAPRDFPNDILNELESLYFHIPELGNEKIEADHQLAPIVIITSNSEKSLPDAFLRRCIFHHIEFPPPEQLKEIALLNLESLKTIKEDFKPKEDLIDDSLSLFFHLRGFHEQLQKMPSTSELLLWLETLIITFPDSPNPLKDNQELEQVLNITLNTLFKSEQDRAFAREIIADWIKDSNA